jgi:hypothetical protein
LFVVKKDAITIGEFNQAFPDPNLANVLAFKLIHIRHLQLGR